LKRHVRILAQASRDIRRLEDFLASKSPAAANRATAAISKAVLSLDELAERTPVVSPAGVRELMVRFGRDGYVIQYRITGDVVLVASIFHTREAR
jgi:plasmid stabilization system protein ParE